MIDPKFVTDIWPILLSILFVVIWCIRLESKVLYLEKDHEKTRAENIEKDKLIWAKQDALQTTLNQILQAIGELKGKLNN